MKLQNYRMNNMRDRHYINQLTIALFVIYLGALIWILLFKMGVHFSYMRTGRSINFIPFSQPVILNGKNDVGESIMNVLIFVPLGMYAGILFQRWQLGKKILLFFFVSFMVESCQYITGLGAADITDIITNTLGGTIGLLIYTGIEKAFNSNSKAQKFINVLATIGTIFMIVFLYLLRTNRLWIRYR